ncbi:hypothetical protein AR687_25005, partial [Flavobacteriaceae bacterium CRH]
ASTTIVWKYSDGINESQQNQTITIADTNAPTIHCIANQTVSCISKVPNYTTLVSATDNCDISVMLTQSPLPGSPFVGETMKITMTAKDDSGNSSDCSFTITQATVTVDAGTDTTIKEGESIQLTATASNTGTFEWDTVGVGSSQLVSPNETTTYTVFFTASNGCQAQDSITITVEKNQKDDTKYGFSPNNDGVNDFWKIDTIEQYPDNEVYIYNRWGDLVFSIKNYDNAGNVFSGVANRKRSMGADVLPEGTYFFDIKISGTHHLKKTKGFLVVKR